MMMKTQTIIWLLVWCALPASLLAQDTVKVSVREFIDIAIENTGQNKVADVNVELSRNRKQMAEDQRFLPSLNFTSEHGIVPGIESDAIPGQEYLDPNANFDWGRLGLFTRMRVSGVQPLFTWGAVGKAVDAADQGIQSARAEATATKAEIELRLYNLYYSYILAIEIERLIVDAEDKIRQIEDALEEQQEENPEDVNESDLYKLDIYKAQFEIQKQEVELGLLFVKETWNYILRNKNNKVYEPTDRFLDPLEASIQEITYYQQSGLNNRGEIQALKYGRQALETYISSLKAQNLPGLYLGFTTTFASTPIIPRQPNPFIVNPENTINTFAGFTIRQNLNFMQARTTLRRTRLEVNRLEYIKSSMNDQVYLEVNQSYRDAVLAKTRFEQTRKALSVAKNWLRMEQLDYDLGFGDSRDYVDAVKQELELRLSELEFIFEFNSAVATLNKTAGLPLFTNTTN